MEQLREPVFKKREIIVRVPKGDAFAQTKDIVAKILYKGEKCINYEVGDTILFNKNVSTELTYFKDDLWKIEVEDYVICKLVDNE